MLDTKDHHDEIESADASDTPKTRAEWATEISDIYTKGMATTALETVRKLLAEGVAEPGGR